MLPAPLHYVDESRSLEHQLSRVLSDFARTMATNFPIQAILDQLVMRIVDILPVTGAGVTLISPGSGPRYIAASDESALRFEQLQADVGQGPCLVAYRSSESVTIPDLGADDRFPEFAPPAIAAGLRAVFTFPLRHGEQQLGALDLYRNTPGDLTKDSMAAAQTLADVTTAYLLNAQARLDLTAAWDTTRRAALHDALTGLPNRTLLLDRLELAFRRNRRSGKISSLLFIDLDRLKSVYDSYGHRVGDDLLVAVARRLAPLLRPGDTLARMSGDEFVVLCEDLDSDAQATAIGGRLVAAMAEPFELPTVRVRMSASIGIANATGGLTPEQLLHAADSAMYEAKRDGGSGYHVFGSHRDQLLANREDMNPDDSKCRGGRESGIPDHRCRSRPNGHRM